MSHKFKFKGVKAPPIVKGTAGVKAALSQASVSNVVSGVHRAGPTIARNSHAAGRAIAHTSHHAGRVASMAGNKAGGDISATYKKAAHDVSAAVQKELTHKVVAAVRKALALRHLHPQEAAVARHVFGNTLPLDRVLVSPLLGQNGRAFTVPGNFLFGSAATMTLVLSQTPLAPLLALVSAGLLVMELAGDLWNNYIIFFGPDGYQSGIVQRCDYSGEFQRDHATLVHELTHVWQGEYANKKNEPSHWTYVMRSCKAQILYGNRTYGVDFTALQPTSRFSDYGVEQQAVLIEQWYRCEDQSFAVDQDIMQSLTRFVHDNIQRRHVT